MASTKAFTSQVAALLVFTLALARCRNLSMREGRQVAQELADERTKQQEALSQTLMAEARAAESRIADEKSQAVENIREATLGVVQSAAHRLIGADVAEADADRAIRDALH